MKDAFKDAFKDDAQAEIGSEGAGILLRDVRMGIGDWEMNGMSEG